MEKKGLNNGRINIKEALKNNWGILLATALILSLFLVSMLFAYKKEWSRAMNQPLSVVSIQHSAEITGVAPEPFQLQNGQNIVQKIEMVSNEVTGISLGFELPDEDIKGQVSVCLEDGKGAELKEWILDFEGLSGEIFYNLFLDEKIAVNAGEEYSIHIESYELEGEVPKLLTTSLKSVNSRMFVDGIEQEASFSYHILDGGKSSLKYLFIGFVSCAILLSAATAIMLIKQQKLEKIFVVTIFLLGSMYLFAIPPFAVPDETAHIVTTYAKSSELLGREAYDADGKVKIEADLSVMYAERNVPTSDSYVKVLKGALGKSEIALEKEVSNIKGTGMTSIGYFPQVIGVSLARIMHLNGYQMLLLGRLAALLFYCLCMYWALRLIPFGKMAMLLVGMFPMTIQQVVSFNYDSVLFGLSFLVFSYLLYLKYTKSEIGYKELAFLVVLTIGITSIKFIYFPILGLGLLIPKEKIRIKGNKAAMSAAILVTAGVTIAVTRLASMTRTLGESSITSTGQGSKLVSYSVSYAITHFAETLGVVWRTIGQQADEYLSSMIATPLGWFEIYVSEIVVVGFVLLVLLSVLQKGKTSVQMAVKEKAYAGILVAGMAGMVLAAMLFAYTYVGSDTIRGVQGRYFLPILPLALLLLQNDVIVIRKDVDRILLLGNLYLQLITICSVTSTVVAR